MREIEREDQPADHGDQGKQYCELRPYIVPNTHCNLLPQFPRRLGAERTAASSCGLRSRVLHDKTRPFHSVHIVHFGAVQQRGAPHVIMTFTTPCSRPYHPLPSWTQATCRTVAVADAVFYRQSTTGNILLPVPLLTNLFFCHDHDRIHGLPLLSERTASGPNPWLV